MTEKSRKNQSRRDMGLAGNNNFDKIDQVKEDLLALKNSNNSGKIQQLFGVSLFGRGREGVLAAVEEYLLNKPNQTRPYWIATVNPEFVMAAEGDELFKKLLGKTDLNSMDGVGLAWALEVKKRAGWTWWDGLRVGLEVLGGKRREGLATGADLVAEMSRLAAGKGWRVFLLGGFGDRAERAAGKLRTTNNKLMIEWCEGEPKVSNEEVLRQINEFAPDFLFVAYGMKKQEEWIDRNIAKLPKCVVMGVGRTFDYLSGDLARAPEGWRKMGLEWLYSLLKEPKRWRRQLALPRFVWKVLMGLDS